MDLDNLRIFVRVAELESFTQAADQLGLAKARVSTAVQQLEAHLGTRLLHRTTRHVRRTSDGDAFLARCKDLLADAEQLQGMFQPVKGGLQGRLRIDLPNSLARDVIIPRLPEFLAAHPRIELGISTTDRYVDVIHEGFDCVLRVGALGDSDLVARHVGVMRMCNVASPSYLQRYGSPKSLSDLSQHHLVHYAATLGTQGAGWEWHDGTTMHIHSMHSALVVNGTDAGRAACLAGLGLMQAPIHGVMHLMAAGQLVEVMPDYVAAPLPVSLLYPHRRQLAPRVQAILDWLAQVVEPYLREAETSNMRLKQ